MEMKEKYVVVKAENGYFVEVECEGMNRRIVCTTDDELRSFMTKTLFAELKSLNMVNITTEYL